MSASRHYHIFISSVQKELVEERQSLKTFILNDALLRQFFEVFLFEDIPASDRRPDNVYLEEVDRCDLYIGLFGDSYGSEGRNGLSPTEEEFDRATEAAKPRIIFVKSENASGRHPKMQALIRKAGDQLIRRRYTSIPELTAGVYASLVEYLGRWGAITTGPFDASACRGAALTDISEEKVATFLDRAVNERGYAHGRGTPMRNALVHLNLLDHDRPSNAAILLFGTQPQRFLLSSEVKCLHFHGTQVRKPIPSYQVYKGDLFQLVDSSIDFVMGKLNRAVGTRALSNDAPVTYEIPRDAVAEAIVNAIAHRDYSSNASVQVMLFTDRLEVWNPGSLPPSLTIDSLRRPHASVPHNPLIAESLFLTRIVERAGSGILDMIELCAESGLRPPEFRQDAGSFIQTLWRPVQSNSTEESVTAQVGTKLALSQHQVGVLSNCLEDSELSKLMNIVGRSDRTKFRHQVLNPLITAGLIEMTIPDKPRSSLQKYRITAKGRTWLTKKERTLILSSGKSTYLMMNPIFSITVKDIQALDDVKSRELVARLCRAELRKNGISPAAVSWGGDQRAKDGGVDVFVDVDPAMGLNGYIKHDQNVFQVKAEKFSKGKIPGEMAPKGKLRPAIAELAKKNGAYIIVSTRDSLAGGSRTESSLAQRITAMKTCLLDQGLDGKVIVDFYDCRKIADWVEEHPVIANWIRHVVGKPILGWKPYAPWAYKESDTEARYLIDERVKVFVPNAENGSDVLSAIHRLRRELSNNVSVRIVGLSGVGKTRLVQALFDKRIRTEQAALDTENVFYTDLSDNPTPQPTAMLEALLAEDSDCVVVVDNCGQDIHKKLTEIAKSSGSKLRLITVEYDIRDDWPEGTECYRLEGSSDEIIKELVQRHYPVLSESDRNKIAEFSDGNARVAFALASTAERGGELARLRDTELFKRLFIQKNSDNNELLRCAEVASLLYSFDGDSQAPGSEIASLASLAEVTEVTFYRNIAELLRRGLVQQRGQWRAVLPHAIANRLAANAVDSFPGDVLVHTLVDQTSDRIARSFSRRVGYLHESEAAKKIVQQWSRPNGRFHDLSKLTDIEFQIFTNIAPVDEQSTLDAIDRAIHNPDFISKDNWHLHDFARIIRSLAYEPALFDQAVSILIRFAIAEPESQNRNSIRDILKSLFFCHLSGTEAKSEQRSNVVRGLILSSDEKKEELGFSLLESALKASDFFSIYGFDFGARKRGYGWWPKTNNDIRSWYNPFIEIAVDAGKNDNSSGRNARVALGQALRGLWVNAGMREEIMAAANVLRLIDAWPEGWLGTRQILKWDKEKIDVESLQELLRLEQEIAPHDLKAEIRAKVLTRGSFTDDFDEDTDDPVTQYRRAEQVAENLGKKASHDAELLFALLPDLFRYPSNEKVWDFGLGVGQEIQAPDLLLLRARDVIERDEHGSVDFRFLWGYISGLGRVRPDDASAFLDAALFDEVWSKWFPDLQRQVKIDEVGYQRLLKSLELNNTPTWLYGSLRCGRVTDSLTVDQILTLVDVIAAKSDDGLFVSIEVLGQVIHCAKEKDDDYRLQLASGCILFLRSIDWKKIQRDYRHIDYQIESILGFALTASSSEHEMMEILHNLIAHAKSEWFSFDQGKFLVPFFKAYPKLTLDAVYVADEDREYITARRLVSLSMGDEHESIVREVPDDVLIKWCEISPEDRYIFAAYTCQLLNKTSDQNNANTSIALSEVAKSIFAGSKDKKAVLDIFCNRFQPTGYTVGALSTILKARLKLLATLNPEGKLKLMPEIAEAEEALQKKIAAIEAREEAEERSRTGSFE